MAENVQRCIFRSTGIFRVDSLFLLQDQVREPRNYLSILQAIGEGQHTLDEIAGTTGLPKQNVSTYLGRLAGLYLTEQRTPVTLRQKRREKSRQERWHLRDPYLRFYFRFIAPNERALELELMDTVHHVFFARVSFTQATQAEAEQHQIQLVDLERLDRDLRAAGGQR